jgi:general L-amino acid transport system permease protein
MASDRSAPRPAVRPSGGSFWYDPRIRAILYQVLLIGGLVVLGVYLVSNTLQNLDERGIKSGFDFLQTSASFDIGEGWLPYNPEDSYWYAFVVGVVNTIRVAFFGIVIATVLGIVIGIARLSPNWLIAKLSSVYVETFRNVPVLLQLYFWYQAVNVLLPPNDNPGNPLPNVYFNSEGLSFPVLKLTTTNVLIIVALLVGCLGAILYKRWADGRQQATGTRPPVLWPSLAMIIGLPVVMWLVTGGSLPIDVPKRNLFGNFEGGGRISPEFISLLLGLSIYTSSFIAEIVRSGILAVNYGQTEAAVALGLKRGQVMRLVILPQALRVIIPPLTGQYLNLTKNSSLAVAIGYPDLLSVTNTSLNQTGQAIECISIMMTIYLSISLATAAFMNWYNKRVALVER